MLTNLQSQATALAELRRELDPATILTVFTILQKCWSMWHETDPAKQHAELCRRFDSNPTELIHKAARRVRWETDLSREESMKYAEASIVHAITVGPAQYMEAVAS